MKRLLDFLIAFIGLLILSPIFLIFMVLIFLQDRHSPIYKAPRVGIRGNYFNMVKMRSMVIDADKSKVDSTSSDDSRITPLGMTIRRYKLDELTQLWNVLLGQMSLVGPRPQIKRDVDLYSKAEKKLLEVSPGITDFSSIVFSDEGDILQGKENPDLAYNQLIRPWKSKLGIIYIENQSLILDLKLIIYTFIAILSKERALKYLERELSIITDDKELIRVCMRKDDLYPAIPPGHKRIVESR